MVNLSLQDPATTGEKLPNYIKKTTHINSANQDVFEYRNKGQRIHLQKWLS